MRTRVPTLPQGSLNPVHSLTVSEDAGQDMGGPWVHEPLPLQLSFTVQTLLSALHGLPASAFASIGQEPPEQYSATSQVPPARHSAPFVSRVQSTSSVLMEATHCPVAQLYP